MFVYFQIGVALIIYLIARFGGPTVITLVSLTYISVKKITEKTSIRGYKIIINLFLSHVQLACKKKWRSYTMKHC